MYKLTREELLALKECDRKKECVGRTCPMWRHCGEGYVDTRTSETALSLMDEKEKLEYTIQGIMHSVDKWLDDEHGNMDEVNRAAQAREIALQALEEQREALHQARVMLNRFYCNRSEGYKLYTYARMPDLKEIIDAIDNLLPGNSNG